MRKAVLAALVLLCLLSCQKEQFKVSGLSVSSSTDIHICGDGRVERDEKVTLKGRVIGGGDDDRYSFRLVSPDGDLVWEDDFSSSVSLELTKGASFPEGAYSIVIYSTNGTEYSGTVTYHGIPRYPFYGAEGLSEEAYTEEFSSDGARVAYGKREKGCQPSYYAAISKTSARDGWGSRVFVTQDII